MTKFELIIPVEWGQDMFDKLKPVFESFGHEYAFARHPVDELSNFEHWHIGATLSSNRTPADIFAQFKDFPQIQQNSVQKIKSHWKTYLCYILHQTKDAIAQGKSAPTEYGGNSNFEQALADYKRNGDFNELINDIVNGKVREYDYYSNRELVAQVIQSGRSVKVEQAFKAQQKNALTNSASRNGERKQAWIFGLAGSGKTELAKEFCRMNNYADRDIYITSSGSNPFDDYKGQPCVIVDDIDSETMSPKTMLKLADCFTGSAVRARYVNKVILADYVIFTSTISPQTWWNSIHDEKTDGNVFQLLRRLNLGTWKIDGNCFYVTTYDGQGKITATARAELPEAVIEKVRSGRNQAKTAIKTLSSLFKIDAVDISGGSVSVQVDAKTGEFSGKIVPGVAVNGGVESAEVV